MMIGKIVNFKVSENLKWIIIICLLAIVVSGQVAIHFLKENQVIRLKVFGTLIEVPNSYFLDATLPGEISLKGEGGRIVLANLTEERRHKLISLFPGAPKPSVTACDIELFRGAQSGVELILLIKKDYSMTFANVEPKLVRGITVGICPALIEDSALGGAQ